MLSTKPVRDRKYLDWVKSLPCVVCGGGGCDPHHIIGHGQGGMSTKASDLFAFPLCRAHHNELHSGVKTWEKYHGTQWNYVSDTMRLAIDSGKPEGEFMAEIEARIINELDKKAVIDWLTS